MKIYISGKISRLANEPVQGIVDTRLLFDKAEAYIKSQGHTPVNPLNNGLPAEAPWMEHMLVDMRLLSECDAVLLLHDWQMSRGSRIEYNFALETGKLIIPDVGLLFSALYR